MKVQQWLEEQVANSREWRELDHFEDELIGPAGVQGFVELEVMHPEDLPGLIGPRSVYYEVLAALPGGNWQYLFSGPINELCGIIKEGWESGDEDEMRRLVGSIEVGTPPPVPVEVVAYAVVSVDFLLAELT